MSKVLKLLVILGFLIWVISWIHSRRLNLDELNRLESEIQSLRASRDSINNELLIERIRYDSISNLIDSSENKLVEIRYKYKVVRDSIKRLSPNATVEYLKLSLDDKSY